MGGEGFSGGGVGQQKAKPERFRPFANIATAAAVSGAKMAG